VSHCFCLGSDCLLGGSDCVFWGSDCVVGGSDCVVGGEQWQAGDVCLQTHGGYGFATEFDIERKWRETRLYRIAPISTNLIMSFVAQNVLGLPRSY
jgi:alkylation response protein AidB-like acyl-CoA dehydrogenase